MPKTWLNQEPQDKNLHKALANPASEHYSHILCDKSLYVSDTLMLS